MNEKKLARIILITWAVIVISVLLVMLIMKPLLVLGSALGLIIFIAPFWAWSKLD